ncbi:MAG: zf-HC2 domain-containing protein [Candidatus Latescibacteria bacterium]|nr:zf-HC2 domain-containing protein [Candidatus Latescibacterota bacterium]
MRCEDARELLTARVDGELDGVQADALATHLDGCAACRAESARRTRERSAWREALAGDHTPDDLRRRVLAAPVPVALPLLLRPLAWAAAAVLAVLLIAPPLLQRLGDGDATLRPAAVTLVLDGGDVGPATALATETLNLGDSPF